MSNPFDDLEAGDEPSDETDGTDETDETDHSSTGSEHAADASERESTTDSAQATGEPSATDASANESPDTASNARSDTAPDTTSSSRASHASSTDEASTADPETESTGAEADESVSPAEAGPAFEYSEVKQKPFYARTETVAEFENAIRTTIVPELAAADVIDEETREIHDAVLRLANERPERVAELVLEERRRSADQ